MSSFEIFIVYFTAAIWFHVSETSGDGVSIFERFRCENISDARMKFGDNVRIENGEHQIPINSRHKRATEKTTPDEISNVTLHLCNKRRWKAIYSMLSDSLELTAEEYEEIFHFPPSNSFIPDSIELVHVVQYVSR